MMNILLTICMIFGILELMLYKRKILSDNQAKIYMFVMIGFIIVIHIISWIE